MSGLPVCMSVHRVCVQCLQRLEEGVQSLELNLETVVSCPVVAGN